MSYRNKTYVIFDGDNDMAYYRVMTAWKENNNIDFDFYNAHDLNYARDTSSEEAIKAQLRERMANSKQMILLVGEKTSYLRKFVPWEIELARKKDIPIIIANLNGDRKYDDDRCPNSAKDFVYTVSVPFRMKIIKHALDDFPLRYVQNKGKIGFDHTHSYNDSIYRNLGL